MSGNDSPRRAAGKPEGNLWKVAVYIRLSREDSHCADESESVANQRAMLREYIASRQDGDGYVLIKEYVDDGVSGTTDDEREAFQQMLSDIKKGLINCVIVKDLARSFRNYSDQGYYLDDWFPRYNVRFISLFHQPLDSYREPQAMRSIAVPIQGVLNESHCAETSDKVRAVLDMKRRRGEHIGSFALYGYQKDPSRKNAILTDPEAAEIVREIFSRFLKGESKTAIVQSLNTRGVPCPSLYKRRQGLRYSNPHLIPGKQPLWCSVTVTNILKNRMYCGDMVQGRCRIKSYKIHIQERVPEREWYIAENTHEAIVSREDFQRVQELLKLNIRTPPRQKELCLFSGFLRCQDCGRAMSRSKSGNHVYYYCRTYKDRSQKACTKHTLRHDRLEQAVLCTLHLLIYGAADPISILSRLDKASVRTSPAKALSAAVSRKKQELSDTVRYKAAAYEDWKDSVISYQDYCEIKSRCQERAEALAEELCSLQSSLEAELCRPCPLPMDAYQISHAVETLSREMLTEFVRRIRVWEGGRIGIIFRFSDIYR